jgi:hypothetical protein
VSILGRVLFAAKAESAKAEPKINWSEIESRLQEISKPTPASDRPVETSLPLEPSAPLAHDPAHANDPPVANDRPVSNPCDPLDILFSPSDGAVSLSSHQDILTTLQAAIAVSDLSNRLTH